MICHQQLLKLTFACLLILWAQTGLANRLEDKQIVVDGDKRSYLLFTPERESKKKRPLVIVLHGGGGNAKNAAAMTGFTEKARKENFIVAYPNASGRFQNRLLTWNAVHCCGYGMKNDIDDVAFISNLIDELVTQLNVDPRRVYVTGMSNGAMMTHRLGIELSAKIAAIAPVVGTLFGDEDLPSSPVAALIINGALDTSVPPAGGPAAGRGADAWDGTPTKPAAHQAQFWARANHCQPKPVIRTLHKQNTQSWTYHCPAGNEVVRYLVNDNGHAWPGGKAGSRRGDAPSQSFVATDMIWDFFSSVSGAVSSEQ